MNIALVKKIDKLKLCPVPMTRHSKPKYFITLDGVTADYGFIYSEEFHDINEVVKVFKEEQLYFGTHDVEIVQQHNVELKEGHGLGECFRAVFTDILHEIWKNDPELPSGMIWHHLNLLRLRFQISDHTFFYLLKREVLLGELDLDLTYKNPAMNRLVALLNAINIMADNNRDVGFTFQIQDMLNVIEVMPDMKKHFPMFYNTDKK